MNPLHIITLFFIYGCLGWCVEVAFAAVKERTFVNRGFLNGPICPIYGFGVLIVVLSLQNFKDQWFILFLASAVLTSILELLTGFLLDKLFHHRWWDYSDMPLNIGGYICPLFSLFWGVICVIMIKFIHPPIQAVVVHIPNLILFIIDMVLWSAFVIDIYITVTEIFKLNRRLKKMGEIAQELHAFSDQLGEGIYKNVMEQMEKGTELMADLEEKQEKIKALKDKYQLLLDENPLVGQRILKAFPNMKSRLHSDELEELKTYLRQKLDLAKIKRKEKH